MKLRFIHLLVTSYLLRKMKWILVGMCLDLSYYVGGMKNYLKHSFILVQSHVKMKPLSSLVFPLVSSICKNEAIFKKYQESFVLISSMCKNEPTFKYSQAEFLFVSSLFKNETYPILYLSWFPFFWLSYFYNMNFGFLIPSSPSAWPIINFHFPFYPLLENPYDEWYY